jgi:hypothetical protein
MNAREMHYDFKMKLNKVDSQKYKNLLVPEIDWKLNEAVEVFVKMIAEPRYKNSDQGFESSQRSIDDIRTIVVDQNLSNSLIPTQFDSASYVVVLPSDYWFKVAAKVYATKGECEMQLLSTHPVQHDDESEVSPFNRSNFEWRDVNIRFFGDNIRIFTDSTFTINRLVLDYIKRPRKINNAQDANGGQYRDLETGLILTGTQSCDLPIGTHRDIVDLAVLITTGDLQIPDYQIKQNKLTLN